MHNPFHISLWGGKTAMNMKSENLAWVGSVVDQLSGLVIVQFFIPSLEEETKQVTAMQTLGIVLAKISLAAGPRPWHTHRLFPAWGRTDPTSKQSRSGTCWNWKIQCFLCCEQEKEAQTTPTLSLHRKSSQFRDGPFPSCTNVCADSSLVKQYGSFVSSNHPAPYFLIYKER